MTDRELMQQALDALEQSNTKAPFGADGVVYWEGVKTHEAAIDALRERLAQPEQEPVAWRFRETKNKPWSISDDGYYISCKRTSGYIIEPLYTAPPQRKPEQEPAEMAPIGSEWIPCVKQPITVHVRAQRPGETHVSTREGITPVKPDDLIMRGVSGEEYPIGREIFESTYRLGAAPPPRKPLTDEQKLMCWSRATHDADVEHKTENQCLMDYGSEIEAAHGIKGDA